MFLVLLHYYMSIWQKFTHIPLHGARLYFWVRSWWPVWFYILNHRSRMLYREKSQELTAVQKRIAADLRRDGIALAHIDEFFPKERMLPVLQRYTQDRLAEADIKTHKSFLRNIWDAVPSLDFENPFVKLAIHDAVLACVNDYMGMLTKFYYFTLNITTPVPDGASAVQSQKWHRDPEDKKLCKVFLYLSDVDETAGPFIYVKGSHHGGRWRALFPQCPPRGSLPPEQGVEKMIPQNNWHTGIGTAGTVIFCDTSGLHRGGYATGKDRIMFTAGYCSQATAWPIRFHYPNHFQDTLGKMNIGVAAHFALMPETKTVTPYFFRKIKKNFPYEG